MRTIPDDSRAKTGSPFRSFWFSVAIAILVIGCAHETELSLISFPDDAAVFFQGAPIVFIATRTGSWTSDIEGSLGRGCRIEISLGAGNHRIRFVADDGRDDEIGVVVESAGLSIGETAYVAATGSGTERKIGAGTFSSFIYSIADSESDVTYALGAAGARSRAATEHGAASTVDAEARSLPPRAGAFVVPTALLGAIARGSGGSAGPRSLDGRSLSAQGDEKIWRMADPSIGSTEPGYSVKATLIYIRGQYEFWLDNDSSASEEDLAAFECFATEIALPRAKALWGGHYDRNGDGRLAILMSDKLNRSRAAVGFFNPCDFFPVDDDPVSEDYNPTSNEADMIYLGLATSDDPAYSPKAIAATAAHEYQHLVRFGKKTYLPRVSGDASASQEDGAFDEGMSHLTESLVGLGLSGGNALFVRRYQLSPQSYSLRYADSNGDLDSAGKRGGNALFFSWLLRKAGSISWDTASPLELAPERSAGRSFLTASLSNAAEGWDLIEPFFGESLAKLYRQYLSLENAELAGLIVAEPSAVDALTSEPIAIDSRMGSFVFGSSTYELRGPALAPFAGKASLPAWSALFIEPFSSIEGAGVSARAPHAVDGALFWGLSRSR